MTKTELMTILVAGVLCFAGNLPAASIVVDYPTSHALFQRDAGDTGTLHIRGTVSGFTEVATVEVRFNGGPWQSVGASGEEGAFAGSIEGPTG